MAKHHQATATANVPADPPSNVAEGAGGISRREHMNMMSAITAPTCAITPDAALWRIAVSEYEATVAALAAFDVRYKAVCAAVERGESDCDIFAFEREELDPMADRVTQARDKLFATPAPDAAALQYKLDILTAYLVEVDSEDAERVSYIDADIRRVLGA